ncbi:MAG: methyltransferase domain-containing protein [Planctomycetota bacterium]|nr:methyltransferase domain-containing protein [Planctomycetota bacterium]
MNLGIAVALSGLLGFVALSYEILWVRVYNFTSGGEAETFGYLLAAYLFGIGAGSWLSRRWCEADRAQSREPLRVLAGAMLGANLCGVFFIPIMAELVRVVPYRATYPFVAVVAAFFGVGLPLLAHFSVPADRHSGARLSYLYFANICGSAAGSLLTGFVLLDVMTLGGIVALLAVLGFFIFVGILLLGSRMSPLRVALTTFALGWLVLFSAAIPLMFDGVYEKLQLKGEYESGTRFKRVIENKSGVITVDEAGAVFGGGAYDGRFNVGLVDDVNWIVRAYWLAGLDRNPKQVLVVGLGSGSWTQVVAHHPSVEHVTVVEINPGYLDLVRREPLVRSLLQNPKVEFVIDDARRFLQGTERRFDLVVQNTTHHWRAHVTNLLSREYLELVRRHLYPGGVFYGNMTQSDAAQRTAATVFPHALRFLTFVAASDAPLHFDRVRWREALLRYRIDGRSVLDAGRPDQAAALERIVREAQPESRADLLRRTEGAPVVTDDNMATEW